MITHCAISVHVIRPRTVHSLSQPLWLRQSSAHYVCVHIRHTIIMTVYFLLISAKFYICGPLKLHRREILPLWAAKVTVVGR